MPVAVNSSAVAAVAAHRPFQARSAPRVDAEWRAGWEDTDAL